MLTITPNLWPGKQWLTIEDGSNRTDLFYKVLSYLSIKYNFPIPTVLREPDTITANFAIAGGTATLFLDDKALTLGVVPIELLNRIKEDLATLS